MSRRGRGSEETNPSAGWLALLLAACLALPVAAAPPSAGGPTEPPVPEGAGRFRAGRLVFIHAPGFEGVARDLARTAPAELERVSAALALPVPDPIRVHLLPRKAGVEPATWGVPAGPEWASGLALTDRPVIVLRTSRTEPGVGGMDAVLTHELVHVIVTQGLGERARELPAWFREGVASHLAREWGLSDFTSALRLALAGEPVPLSRLEEGFPDEASVARDAYLQSFSFVGWMVEEGGEDVLGRLLGAVRSGRSFDAAVEAVFGEPVRALERRWRRSFMWAHAWVPVLTSASTPWLLMVALFTWGWWRKKRRAERTLQRWEEDEAAERERIEGEASGGESDDDSGRDEPAS